MAALLVGCSFRPEAPAGGVRGQVLVGPACPVVQVGQTCPDQPYAAHVKIIDRSGGLIARLEANERGEFAVELPEGTYTLVASAADQALLPWAEPLEIVVRPGQWTEIAVLMDSGIR